MIRTYHRYEKWECYKHGFYDNVSLKEKEIMKFEVCCFFDDRELTNLYMNRVINEWIYSCENFLTNNSINQVAYLGQAACCLCFNIPSLATMYGWKFLSVESQVESDRLAIKNIKEWRLKRKLSNTLNHGRKEDMKTGYQMKLLLS